MNLPSGEMRAPPIVFKLRDSSSDGVCFVCAYSVPQPAAANTPDNPHRTSLFTNPPQVPYCFFSPDNTRRFPLINTPTGSADPFKNPSRTRPSASIFTLPGTALAVTYHPAGS